MRKPSSGDLKGEAAPSLPSQCPFSLSLGGGPSTRMAFAFNEVRFYLFPGTICK